MPGCAKHAMHSRRTDCLSIRESSSQGPNLCLFVELCINAALWMICKSLDGRDL